MAGPEPRRMIDDTTLLRIKHKEKNKFVGTIKRWSWEAATLSENSYQGLAVVPGSYKEFRIIRQSDEQHVRIQIKNPMFDGYVYAYSPVCGGIYFNKHRNCDKQLWKMIPDHPVDGSAVVFRNKHWPKAGLVYHHGPDTDVYCLNRDDQWIEEWILEIV